MGSGAVPGVGTRGHATGECRWGPCPSTRAACSGPRAGANPVACWEMFNRGLSEKQEKQITRIIIMKMMMMHHLPISVG